MTGTTPTTPSPLSGGYVLSPENAIDLKLSRIPVKLDSCDTAWRVDAGQVQVFAVELESDGGWEAALQRERFPLVTLDSGKMAFALPESSNIGLIMVGIDESARVVPVPLALLTHDATTGASEVANMVAAWLESLITVLELSCPTSGVPLVAGEPVEVEEGQYAWPTTRTVWVPASDGLILFGGPVGSEANGENDLQDAPTGTVGDTSARDGLLAGTGIPPGVVLPVPSGAWLFNPGPSMHLLPQGGTQALSRPEAWDGFMMLQGALGGRISVAISDKVEAASARREEIRRYESTLQASTYTSLAAILNNRYGAVNAAGNEDVLVMAFEAVAKELGVDVKIPPGHLLQTAADPVDALARLSGVRSREVMLNGQWWKGDCGPLLAKYAATGTYVALIPAGVNRYDIIDQVAGTRMRIDREAASTLSATATLFYRPLPSGPLAGRDVLRYLLRPLKPDLYRLAGYAVIAGLMSLVTPLVTKTIFSSVVPGLQRGNLLWLAGLMVTFAISSFGFGMAQQFAVLRVEGRSSTDLQAALWDRVLDLPMPFFRRFTAGDLTMRVMGVEQIRSLATTTVTTAMLAVTIGLSNLVLAFFLQTRLALFGLVAIAIMVAVMVRVARYQISGQRLVQSESRSLFATAMQMVGSVGKLQAACAESRAFAIWANRFAGMKRAFFNAQLGFVAMISFTAAGTAIATAMVFLGVATLPVGAVTGATFIAFNAAFSQVVVSITSMSSVVTFISQAVPAYDNLRPVLSASRETEEIREEPGVLRGSIEVSHISFRYDPQSPMVLEDVTFQVNPGEMVAIVGPSGAGKSSLMRILLGFEKPEIGSVRFDGKDLDSLDLRAVRSQIGVVLQNAGLMPGDIYTNIVGTRPLTVDDAWVAARTAGLEEDIKDMPMGMHTFVAEGVGTISGGQRQRLLIARAVAGMPRILLFDEATSALDNLTQAQVAQAIARLRATRVVIAHRLSTVRSADRILVIVDGHLVQEGSYDKLMESTGPFRELAGRQLLA